MKTKIVINAPVVTGFFLLSFLATLAGQMSGQKATDLFFSTGGSFINPLTYLRFFTHVLGHLSWEHFLTCSLTVLLLGPVLEEKYGSKALLLGLLFAAGLTGLLNLLLLPELGLYGGTEILCCLIILSAVSGFRSGEIPLTFLLVAAVMIAYQVQEKLDPSFLRGRICYLAGALGGAFLCARLKKR